MTIKTLKTLHEEDWKNKKIDYDFLKNDKDISERMELLLGFFKKFRPSRILDIGCGSGYLGHLLKQLDSNVIMHGFDVSEHAVSQIKSYDKAYFCDLDKSDIPEDNSSFDMIVCSEVLEHIYDVDHCLNEIKRILIPGGKAIITTPNFSYWKYRTYCLIGKMPKIIRDPRHLHIFNHNLLYSKCSDENFDIAYSTGEKNGFLNKMKEKILKKTIVLCLTKKKL